MLAIGQQVYNTGHGLGTIVKYNGGHSVDLDQAAKHGLLHVAIGLGVINTDSFYGGDRYPYVVKFESGYEDVYSDREILSVDSEEYKQRKTQLLNYFLVISPVVRALAEEEGLSELQVAEELLTYKLKDYFLGAKFASEVAA